MKSLTVLLAALAFTACRSLTPDPVPVALPPEEASVIAALLEKEAVHPQKPRPIIVLTPTNSRLPLDSDIEADEDVPESVQADFAAQVSKRNSALAALRTANRAPASLAGIALPQGAVLFPASEYTRASKSQRKFDAFVQNLGGVEPLVLSVSRPSLGPEKALIVLHIDSTWSGCGGVNLFSVNRATGASQLEDVLVFW